MNRNSKLYRAFYNTSRFACGAADLVGMGVFKAYDGVMYVGDGIGNGAKTAWHGLKDGAALRHAPRCLEHK